MVISCLYRPSFFSQVAAAILFKKKNRAPSKIPYKIHNQKKIKQLLVWHYGKKAITLQPLLRELDSRMKQV